MNDYRKIAAMTLHKLAAIYPAFPNDPEKIKATVDVWSETFEEERITVERIKRGLYWCRRDKSQYACSIGAFLEYCNTKTPGDYNAEYQEEKRRRIAHKKPDPMSKERQKEMMRELKAQIAVTNYDQDAK